ncbi:MAG: AAA family ATPase, partial [Magnetococcales bacterium]|nr:AAA family ATPase [Magnetococcales bacterium]
GTGRPALPLRGPTATPPAGMESERKNVTVLFADISGFTAMSEKMDPEAVTEVMNGCLKMLADIVLRYEGHVDKFIGDCIMAIFGAPITHENDPELALRAALDMKKEMEEYNRRLPVKLEKALTLHTGINSGMVIAGGVGSDQKMEYTVMGDTVNLASRLESIAGSGQVFVSVYTYNLTRNLFEFIRHEPIKVKGKKEPVAVYEVVRAKSLKAQDRKPVQAAIPLVGRSQEIQTLRDCADKLMAGQGQVVFLISEPGIGKSRIQLEAKKHFQGSEAQVIEGVCRSFSRSTSYHLFSEILQSLFNIDSEDLEEAIAGKLTTSLPALVGLNPANLDAETREAIVFLGAILGVNLGDHYDIPLAQMDAQEVKMATFRAVSWFFTRLAKSRPLVLVMEDLHHADSSSIELIAYLFDALKSAPVMLLMLMRPSKDNPANKLPMISRKVLGDRAITLNFELLTPEECDQMVRHLLDSTEIPPPVLQLVRERADGNPMYIEEIVRSLQDEEVLRRDDSGAIRVLKDLAGIAIPSSIQGMIIARIDKLQNELKDILHIAAVIGPVFKLALLQRVCERKGLAQTEERLEQFADMGIVFESKSFPEIEYSFRNILIQEAIYSTLLIKKQKELHALVAGEIIALYESRLEDHFEVLASHYEKAGNGDQAYDFLTRSGIAAMKAYANDDAAKHFRRALDLAQGVAQPVVPVADVLLYLADVQELAGDMEAAIQSRRQAAGLMTTPARQADIIRRIGRIHEKLGHQDQAIAVYDQAATLLENAPDSLEMGLLLLNRSWIMNSLSQHDNAAAMAGRALAIFEAHGAREEVAMACNNLGVIHEHRGDFDQATAFSEKSLAIFSEVGNRRQTANLYLSLGFLHNKKREPEIALDYFTKSSRIMERIGNPYGAGTALMCQGRCCVAMGRTDEGEAALKAALRLHRKLDLKRKIVSNQWELIRLYLDRGNHQAARELIEDCKGIVLESRDQGDLAKTLGMEAEILVLEGRKPDDKLREAIALHRQTGQQAAADALEARLGTTR